MKYVFISYSSKDKEKALFLKTFLESKNIDVWMAPDSISLGSYYAREITNGIRECSCFIVLLSNNTNDSVFVPKEVERALTFNRPILPLLLEDVTLNDEFTLYLSSIQMIRMPQKDDESAMKDLLEAVNFFVGNSKKYEGEVYADTPALFKSNIYELYQLLNNLYDSFYADNADLISKALASICEKVTAIASFGSKVQYSKPYIVTWCNEIIESYNKSLDLLRDWQKEAKKGTAVSKVLLVSVFKPLEENVIRIAEEL